MSSPAININGGSNHSELTRAGIARARARGVPRGTHSSALAERNREQAEAFAESLRPVVVELICGKVRGPTSLARELNRLGVPTARGGSWHPTSARRLLDRLELGLARRTTPESDPEQTEVVERNSAT